MKQNLTLLILSVLVALGAWAFVTLSNDFYYTTRVPIKYTNLPADLVVDNTLPNSLEIKLKATGMALLFSPPGDDNSFIVPVSFDSAHAWIDLFKLVNEQSWLTRYSVIDIYPAKINIKINKAGETVKPVTADLSLQYEDGFGLVGKIKITPNSVKLKGSEKLLAGINSVKTKKTILTGLKEKTVIEVQLEGIEGVSIAPQKVTIELDVQKIADREIEGVVLSVLDKPKERDILLNPDKVTVTVRGGIDIISTLKAEEIKAVINYPEIVNDTTGITVPKVILPETIDFIDIKPPHIKYIIKKN